MPGTVLLNDLVNALEMQFEEVPSFVDLDSGEVYTIPREILREVEDCPEDEEPDLVEWQKSEVATANRILFSGRCVRVPDDTELNEWDLMDDFAREVESPKIRAELLDAIRGRGAFGRFKDAVHKHRMQDEWHEFRTEALKEIAIEFCEEHELTWK